MSQPLDELEQRIGYRFHDRNNLRRALTCESAINEHHPDAINQNCRNFAFIGDAVLKYIVVTLLYNKQNQFGSPEELHDKVKSFTINSNLSRIGRELNLSNYIIRGRGVSDVTDQMLADAVEAILGAIVIDQQQQENGSENVLSDVIARLFSIKRKTTPKIPLQNNGNKKPFSCCKCFSSFLMRLLFAVIVIFFSVQLSS